MKHKSHDPTASIQYRISLAVPLMALVLLFLLVASAAAQESTPEPTPEPPIYVVQPGDTLFRIAERFGSTVEAIVAANDIADPSLIGVGQKLVIPTSQPELVPSPQPRPDRRVHPVRPGETLPFLAYRYGTSIWVLGEVNELDPLNPLLPGQELTIPPPTAPHEGTPGFPEILARPASITQGRTLLLEIGSGEALTLSASFLGHDLTFLPGQAGYWALAGVDALTPEGVYPLALTITEAGSGDHLTLQETFTVTEGSFGTYNIVVPASRTGLLDPTIVQAEREKVEAVFAGGSEERLWDGVFGFPLAGELRTTAPFGQRRSYNSGPVASYHSGHDFGADEGVPVLAPMTGTVVLAEPLQVRGQVVIIDHGWGVFTGFWHLSQIDVAAGQKVGKGKVVGLVGDTGLSTGPHLHWEMRVWGVPVDPFQWTEQTFP